MSEQTQTKMDRLREALKTGGVEIDRYRGAGSGTLLVAVESANRADEANKRGERIARIVGTTEEYDVSADEVRELLKLGAVVGHQLSRNSPAGPSYAN